MKIKIGRCGMAAVLLGLSMGSMAQSPEQEREYTRQREAARLKEANEASAKQNAANNAPTSGKRFEPAGVLSTVAEREAAKAKAEAALQERVRQNAINREIWQRKDAEQRAMWNASAAADAERKAPINAFYSGSGLFNSDDVYILTRLTIDSEGKRLTTTDAALLVPASYKNYLELPATASYEETADAILKFGLLAGKAIDAADKLAARFPGKARETAILRLKIWSEGGFDHRQPRFATEFMELVNGYPEEAKSFAGQPKLEGALFTAIQYRQQGKLPAADLLTLQKTYVTMVDRNTVASYLLGKTGNQPLAEYLNAADVADVGLIAAKTGLRPVNVITRSSGNQVFYGRFFSGSPYVKDGKDNLTPHQASLIKTFALNGDPESGAIYGLRIIQGWTDEDPAAALPWFRKAAESNTPNAKENLAKICEYKIKGLKEYCREVN